MDTGIYEVSIVGTGRLMDHPFIVFTRSYDADIDTALSRQAQCGDHILIDDQIRCADIDILLGRSDHMHIDALADTFMICRDVVIWLHESFVFDRTGRVFPRIELAEVLGCHLIDLPDLKEETGDTPCRFSFDHHGGIFPVTEPLLLVDVLIRQIQAAAEGDLSVDRSKFSMVTVILNGREERAERVKYLTLDAQ